jgi:hypothetical protein
MKEPENHEAGEKNAPPSQVATAPGAVEERAQVDLKPPSSFTRSRSGAYEKLSSPDAIAQIVYAAVDGSELTQSLIDEAGRALGVTNVRLAPSQPIFVGSTRMPAQAADGACTFSSGDGGIAVALVDVGDAKKVLVAYAWQKDVTDDLKREVMETIASMQKKP